MKLTDEQKAEFNAAGKEDTDKEPDTLAEKAASVGMSVAEYLATFAKSGLNAATAGAYGVYDRNAQAGIRKLTNMATGKNNVSYNDLLKEVTENERRLRGENPTADLGGAITGSVVLGNKVAPALQGANWLTRAGKMAGAGALEALGVRAGQGDLTAKNAPLTALFGTGAGGAGSILSDAVPPVVSRLGRQLFGVGVEKKGAERAAESLRPGGEMANRTGHPEGVPIPTIADEMKPNQVVGDIDTGLRTETAGAAANPNNREIVTDLRRMADERLANKDARAEEIVNNHVGPSKGKAQTAADLKIARDNVSDQYKEMLEQPRATEHIIPRTSINAQIDRALDKTKDVSSEHKMVEWLSNEVTDYLGASGNPEKMTPEALLKLKQSISAKIDSFYNSPTQQAVADTTTGNMSSIDHDAVKYLTAVKDRFDHVLERTMPGYKSIAGQYADISRSGDIYQVGADMARLNKFTPDDIKLYMNSLDNDAQKANFVEGVMGEVMNKAQAGNMAHARQLVAPGSKVASKLEAALGEDAYKAFAKDVTEYLSEMDMAKQANSAIEGAAKRGASGANDPNFDRAGYMTAGAGSAAGGHLQSLGYVAARLFRDPADKEAANQLMNLLQTQGGDDVMDIYRKIVANAPKQKGPSRLGLGLSTIAGQMEPPAGGQFSAPNTIMSDDEMNALVERMGH